MRRFVLASVTLWLFSLGCSSTEPGSAAATRAPAIGKADSTDAADRSCQVVLREVSRVTLEDGSYAVLCEGGACSYMWRATVAVADAVPPEARVRLMYRLSTDTTWWEVESSEFGFQVPGFKEHRIALSEHLFGPETPNADDLSIEVIAFLVLPDGTRLFDHNVFPGDLENARLHAGNGYAVYARNACTPEMGFVSFFEGYTHSTTGALRQGKYLWVSYDNDRLPNCRNTHNGFPAWNTLVHILFHPGNQYVSGSVRGFVLNGGAPTPRSFDAPFWTKIPEDATEVEIWFENYSGAGSSCHEWDSNWGENYRFAIWPDASSPRCLGVEKESGIRSEDPRMAHNEPFCLAYDVSANLDASCEFYVDGFGDGFVGHYGIPFHWLVAYVKTLDPQGDVLAAGLYVHARDNATNEETRRFLLGIEEAPGVWRAGFAYNKAWYGQPPTDYTVLDYAFFLDVRRGDRVVRLWHSRHGVNYRLEDAFTLPAFVESVPYGSIRWADQSSGVLDSKHACLEPANR